MKLEQQQEIVRALVSDYASKHALKTLPYDLVVFASNHIIEIGTSILCTKWNVGYPGGDFVQAVVDNDLREAFGRADDVNQHCIKFYLMLMYNVGAPASLFQ
jgi:hypothetical protein